ncbi:ovochymase-2-like isoform X2 [Mya arenaria]|nr:ovochymase-2-like isoform X2 [Mya arenaria]
MEKLNLDLAGIQNSLIGQNRADLDVNDFGEILRTKRDATKYIVGGRNASSGKHPYYGKLYMNDTFVCGGTILHQRVFLSSTDCIFSAEPSFNTIYTIVVGDFDPDVVEPEEQTLPVYGGYYTNYNRTDKMMSEDAIFWILYSNITFGSYVQPVELPSLGFAEEKALKNGDTCYAVGFGLVSQDPDVNAIRLQELPVQVKWERVCSGYLWNSITERVWSRNYYCSITPGSGICDMDRGGPLMCDRSDGSSVQIGIISYGTRNCETGLSVYFRTRKINRKYKLVLELLRKL